MLKNLWEGSADFAWVPFAIDIRRIPYVDFMPTIDRAHSGIFIRYQTDQEFHWNLFLVMFSKELWCTLFVVALIISLTIFAMEFVWLKPVCYVLQNFKFYMIFSWSNLYNISSQFCQLLIIFGHHLWPFLVVNQLHLKLDLTSLTEFSYLYICYVVLSSGLSIGDI